MSIQCVKSAATTRSEIASRNNTLTGFFSTIEMH
jgi:hypothetical protein